jgi:hypothetical protein
VADDPERWIAEVASVDDAHWLVSIAPIGARGPVVCRCGWSTRPTTRERGIAVYLKHRQRIAIERIAELGAGSAGDDGYGADADEPGRYTRSS